MSLKKIEQIKTDKGFKLPDLIIYGVIILLVVALFIAVFATKNKNPLTGIRVYLETDVVFEYEFGSAPVYNDKVKIEEDGKGITVTISDGNDYNVLYIDKDKKTVKMTEANCRGKQCLYFKEISDNNKFIYCNPHRLKVEPFSRDYDDPNIIF